MRRHPKRRQIFGTFLLSPPTLSKILCNQDLRSGYVIRPAKGGTPRSTIDTHTNVTSTDAASGGVQVAKSYVWGETKKEPIFGLLFISPKMNFYSHKSENVFG